MISSKLGILRVSGISISGLRRWTEETDEKQPFNGIWVPVTWLFVVNSKVLNIFRDFICWVPRRANVLTSECQLRDSSNLLRVTVKRFFLALYSRTVLTYLQVGIKSQRINTDTIERVGTHGLLCMTHWRAQHSTPLRQSLDLAAPILLYNRSPKESCHSLVTELT